ncbi:Gp138 family membrane-puncturing spike protein [uncultured Brevibacillus sp.]|uniref:Gp138 family membrane-puncturing spike protein n=1 Tax=uncultured Brevibacillus sp. TaxID=169970 RepID=UPI00259A2815|nr:Gp138 family membrane-puncturing spike protein [uncultured Brevibacillus sp.]
MTVDPSGSLAKLIDGVVQKRLADMCVAFPCRVISFDNTGRAVVLPLFQLTDEPPSPIQNVPISSHKYKNAIGQIEKVPHIVEHGDLVFVVCADRQIRDALTGQVTAPSSKRIHDRNDAVIVGVF